MNRSTAEKRCFFGGATVRSDVETNTHLFGWFATVVFRTILSSLPVPHDAWEIDEERAGSREAKPKL